MVIGEFENKKAHVSILDHGNGVVEIHVDSYERIPYEHEGHVELECKKLLIAALADWRGKNAEKKIAAMTSIGFESLVLLVQN